MGAKTLEACQEHGCVYLHAIGGAAQIYARCVKRVPAVYLKQFGSPEAVWQMEVEDFPAVVTMDAHGRSLHAGGERRIEGAAGGGTLRAPRWRRLGQVVGLAPGRTATAPAMMAASLLGVPTMNLSEWLESQTTAFAEAGDAERLRMAALHVEAYQWREDDPDRVLAALAEGRRLAVALREPWWVLFYDAERVEALLQFKRDYREALGPAVAAALEVGKSAYQAFPGRFAVWDNLVAAYIGSDAEGHAQRIGEALEHLDRELPTEPDGARYLLLARRQTFAMECGDLEAAHRWCGRSLDLCAVDRDQSRAVHFASFVYCNLCHIAGLIDDTDSLTEWAEVAVDLAQANGHRCEEAEALSWQAVAALAAGEAAKAKRHRLRAANLVTRIKMPPKRGYYEAQVRYHTQRNDRVGVLQVRDAELEAIVGCGRLLYEARVRIARCELLAEMERLTPADLAEARSAVGRLRCPDALMHRLGELG